MSHWYNTQGEPCHTVIGKNGKERKTTIRDARKNGWMPSVTTVLRILAKPALDKWKFRQITDVAYKSPADPKEFPDTFNERIVEAAFEQVDNAADTGTLIHAGIEAHYKEQEFDYTQEIELPETMATVADYVQMTSDWVMSNDVVIEDCEVRLVNKELGYAGLTDAVINRNGKHGILDFKTRKTSPKYKVTPYDEQPTQIAAYHMAKFGEITDDAVGCNLYLSTTELGRVEACWYDAETLRMEFEKFKHILSAWKLIKQYDSSTL
jgi:hypothetical protein